jgi:ribosomal-protein-alanine N-acetyltransferase
LRSFHGQRHLKATIQIVRFRPRHLPRVLRIERASFGTDAWPRSEFLEYYRECGEWFVVAKLSGRIAGYAITCMEKRAAELASIAVHPDYRRRGVADALLRHMLDAVASAGLRRVELMVRCDNPAGQQLYRSLGFRRVRRVHGYYDDGTEGILMAKSLP